MIIAKNYFRLEELVPKDIFERRGRASIELLDRDALPMINSVREVLGTPLTINDWLWGGVYSQSGLRDYSHYSTYWDYIQSLSQHKFGRAFDSKSDGAAKDAVRELVVNRHSCPLVSFIEIDRPWIHTDCRINRCGSELVLWSPDRGYVTISEYLSE